MNIFIYCSSVKTAVQHVGPVVEERVVDLVNSPLHPLAKFSVIDVAVPPQGDIARLSLIENFYVIKNQLQAIKVLNRGLWD